MKRNDILKGMACFRCGMRLNKYKCPFRKCTPGDLAAKRTRALKVHSDVTWAIEMHKKTGKWMRRDDQA